ncbi:hypothetical protein L1887_27874 [Cichorium endivia]|nr:hypothetical protein L1887_27874 [Cichorium endivia]
MSAPTTRICNQIKFVFTKSTTTQSPLEMISAMACDDAADGKLQQQASDDDTRYDRDKQKGKEGNNLGLLFI